MREAYYILQHSDFCVIIPMKRRKGHLKSCFGWHGTNRESNLFDLIKPKNAGDTCDIDGYLEIRLHLFSWENGYDELIQKVIESLQKCFPYVEKFTKDKDKFWEIVEYNASKKTASRKNRYQSKIKK